MINNRFAKKAIEKGADGLIAVAAGLGGHAGTHSPFALIQEIREWFDGPLLLGGSIAHGRSILAARAAGADLAYIGSAFIASEEANAEQNYKQMVIDSTAADIVYSRPHFTGIHANYLRPSISAAGLGNPSQPALAFEGGNDVAPSVPKPWRDIWGAGHGIGAIDAVMPTAAIVERLSRQYEDAKAQLRRLVLEDRGKSLDGSLSVRQLTD